MIAAIVAAPAVDQEPDLVKAAEAAGVEVVRRCVDAADLLAAAAVAPSALVVVSADLPRLSRDAVERLGPGGRPVVGLAIGPAAERWLVDVGLDRVVRVGASASATWAALVAAAGSRTPASRPSAAAAHAQAPTGVWASGCWMDGTTVPNEARVEQRRAEGALIAVWGAQGAPGRTSVAIALADALAAGGRATCLVDADTYAPSVDLALGLDDRVADLIVACRCADGQPGRDAGPSALRALARPVRGRLAVVAGVPEPARWSELRPGPLDRLWQDCRAAFDVTVVDVGFCVERDDDPGPLDQVRNAAAITALAQADLTVVVADSSALGAARVGAAWPSVAGLVAGRATVVVRNRAGRGGRDWLRALHACSLTGPVVDLPCDEAALAACWARGQTLTEVARRSKLRRAVDTLAETCLRAVPTGTWAPDWVDTGR